MSRPVRIAIQSIGLVVLCAGLLNSGANADASFDDLPSPFELINLTLSLEKNARYQASRIEQLEHKVEDLEAQVASFANVKKTLETAADELKKTSDFFEKKLQQLSPSEEPLDTGES